MPRQFCPFRCLAGVLFQPESATFVIREGPQTVVARSPDPGAHALRIASISKLHGRFHERSWVIRWSRTSCRRLCTDNMEMFERGPELIPGVYSQSKFWRFVLDTKAEEANPDEPRFKQFSDNLRNFAVAAVMFKAAKEIPFGAHHLLLSLGRVALTLVAVLTTGFSASQQFGLLLISSHWFMGWGFNKRIPMHGPTGQKYRRQMQVRIPAAIFVTALVLWAMIAFVVSPIL